MADEKCPLLLVCKVLAYSLQSDPSRRFRSVSQIVQILRLTKPEPDPDDDVGPLQLLARDVRRIQEAFVNGMKGLVQRYLASLDQNGLSMPMVAILEAEIPKRIDAEVKMYLGDWQSVSESSLVPCLRREIRAIANEGFGCVPELDLAHEGSIHSLRCVFLSLFARLSNDC
jgi:hypothetical protein